MTIQKMKPKLSKKNTQITQVHGSMKAKKVLDMLKNIEDKKEEQAKSREEALKNIEDKKEEQAKSREEALKKKEGAKEAFLKCKSQFLPTT